MQNLGLHTIRPLQYAEVLILLENNIQTPLPKHTWDMRIIAIWDIKVRNSLNAHNNNRLIELAKGMPEANWEINYIHDNPYPSALSTEETPGLNKVRKLPNDHLRQTPQGLEDKRSTSDQLGG
jgi:hypothetical protein